MILKYLLLRNTNREQKIYVIKFPEICGPMNILIDNLKQNKNISCARNIKYAQNDFVEGIIDVISNNICRNRYKNKSN